MKDKLVLFLKVLYKVLPFLISALGGGALAMSVSGCKIGSLVSLASPAL